MNDNPMESILAQFEHTPTFTVYHPDTNQPYSYRLALQPVMLWEPHLMEQHLGLKLPDGLCSLWTQTAGIDIWRETGGWTLRLSSPFEAMFRTLEANNAISSMLCAGDLVIGDYQDGAAWLVVRCRADAYDFGRVCVASTGMPREAWQVVADSLSDFLYQTIEMPQVDYWMQAVSDPLFPCA